MEHHSHPFPFIEKHPWLGAVSTAIGGVLTFGWKLLADVTAQVPPDTHAQLDGWLDTGAKVAGLFVLGLTGYAQYLTIKKRRRERKERSTHPRP
jgi:hypothetical protein